VQASQSIIIILLVSNLIATVWFGLDGKSSPVISQAEKSASHELPSAVSSEIRDDLYAKFAKAFNAGDYDALYDMFGPAAKAQFTKESAEKEFKKLIKFFKAVEGGAFTHSELAGTQGNTNIYNLFYAVTLPNNSELGDHATLKITIAVQGADYQIYGIRLNTVS